MAPFSRSRNTMMDDDYCLGVLSICARGDTENRIRASEQNLGDCQLRETRLHIRVSESTPTIASSVSNWTYGKQWGEAAARNCE